MRDPIIGRANYLIKVFSNVNFHDVIGKLVQFRSSKSHIPYAESLKKIGLAS